MSRLILSLLMLGLGIVNVAQAANDEYPYRVRYPDVTVITTDDLNKRFNEVVVIDVRSKYEYDTLHVKDAINIPLKSGFGDKVAALRQKQNKPFVFYCNGKTCHKSYDAALLAEKARLDRVFAYDAGIFDWAKAQPEKTALLGKSPIKTEDLISGDAFHARLLDPKTFSSKVGDKSIVLDVRDKRQRDTALFPFKEQRAQLDEMKKIDEVVDDAKAKNKTLLVYDEAGKQVQWFQYYLESKGIKDYYFMKGGAEGHFNAMYGKVVLGSGDKDKKEEAKPAAK
jgi:rhodanese-related sulfurtransferase